jgi:signal transduction histidine kinase
MKTYLPKPDEAPGPIQILHLEDSVVDHELIVRSLRVAKLEFRIERVDTLDEFATRIRDGTFDLILADYRLPGFTAIEAWDALATVDPRPPFILVSGAIGEPAAVAAIQSGMSDYVLKDDLGKLAHVVQRALEVHRARLSRENAIRELAASEKRLAGFAEHLQTTIEQERTAIAREIHDDIGGSLAAIKFDLSWMARHHADPETLAHLSTAQDMLQHALGASQRIMMNLRPAILDQGLVAAIQWLASSFERRTAIKTLVRMPPNPIHLDKRVELAAFRTSQEALTNIGKHARCQHVTIDLVDDQHVLTLEVSDDGQGLSEGALENPKAFGIKGMRERAHAVGGWLDVSTNSQRGTSIILSVPLSRTGETFA